MARINYLVIVLICSVCLFCDISSYSKTGIYRPISFRAESIIELDLLAQAQAISVKVIANQSAGSGIIIQQWDNVYTVVTNRHVATRGDKYQIITSDNHNYIGRLVVTSEQDDLAILEFTSVCLYPVAVVNTEPLKLQDTLYAVGFLYNSNLLKLTPGKLFLRLVKSLKQGYELGYSNAIYKGMSGGAILNASGEVVGLNGRSANPIIPDYQYQDRTYPSQQQQKKMAGLSWGIPIAKAIRLMPE